MSSFFSSHNEDFWNLTTDGSGDIMKEGDGFNAPSAMDTKPPMEINGNWMDTGDTLGDMGDISMGWPPEHLPVPVTNALVRHSAQTTGDLMQSSSMCLTSSHDSMEEDTLRNSGSHHGDTMNITPPPPTATRNLIHKTSYQPKQHPPKQTRKRKSSRQKAAAIAKSKKVKKETSPQTKPKNAPITNYTPAFPMSETYPPNTRETKPQMPHSAPPAHLQPPVVPPHQNIPDLDPRTQRLIEDNIKLMSSMKKNLAQGQYIDNIDLMVQFRDNVYFLLRGLDDLQPPGKGKMPQLPVQLNTFDFIDEHFNPRTIPIVPFSEQPMRSFAAR